MAEPTEGVTLTKPDTEAVDTPAAAPVEETSRSAVAEDDVTADDWSNLGDDVPEQPVVEPAAEADAETEKEEVKEPAVPDAVDTQPEAEPEPEPEPTPEPTQPEPEVAEVATPEPPQMTQEAIEQMWSARETALVDTYHISEEDGEALLTKAEETFPKLAAKIQVETEKAVWTHINQVLPDLIGRIQQEKNTAVQQEEAFYTTFPKLKDRIATDAGARSVVESMRNLFRQQNPSMPQGDLDAQVGAAAMVALKIPFTESDESLPQTTTRKRKLAAPAPHQPPSPRPAGPATHQPKLGEIETFAEQLAEEDSHSAVTF